MIAFQDASCSPIPSALPSPSSEATIVGRMAQTMLELAAHDRPVDRDALILAGFTRAEIAAYSEPAADIANASGRAG
jgi:hypothetical protein